MKPTNDVTILRRLLRSSGDIRIAPLIAKAKDIQKKNKKHCACGIHHPEQQKNEIYLGNSTFENPPGWKTTRFGKINHKSKRGNSFPVFVLRSEVEAHIKTNQSKPWGKDTHRCLQPMLDIGSALFSANYWHVLMNKYEIVVPNMPKISFIKEKNISNMYRKNPNCRNVK